LHRFLRAALAISILFGIQGAILAQTATLTLQFTNNGEPLEDPAHGKFYLYEPEERDDYIAWGHGAKQAEFPEGVYDLVIRYKNGELTREIERTEVEFTGDTEEEIEFEVAVAKLIVEVTSGGEPVPIHTARYRVYRAGQRGNPVATKRPGATVTIPPGLYDIEISVRDMKGMQSTWVENFDLEGLRVESVEIGPPSARVVLKLLRDGRPYPGHLGLWRVYPAGERRGQIGERRSGEALDLEAGVYDIGIFYRDGGSTAEQWLENVRVRGLVEREIELTAQPTRLVVEIEDGGSSLPGAWYTVYPAGDRRSAMASAPGGRSVDLPAGTYDVGCFLRQRGLRAERWLTDQQVVGPLALSAELDLRPSSIRVLPERRRRRSPSRRTNILLLVDSSAEMNGRFDGDSRMAQVQRTVRDLLRDPRESDARIGVRAFGITPLTQHDCKDSLVLSPFKSIGDRRLATSLDLLRPAGQSPIAYTLAEAAGDLSEDDRNLVVLITGSTESCGGNVCAGTSRLLRRGLADEIHVVALGLERDAQRVLDCVGEYHTVRSRRQLRGVLREILRDATREEEGNIAIFETGWDVWVTGGALGERIEISAGTYDMIVRSGGRTHVWENVRVSGEFETNAGAKP